MSINRQEILEHYRKVGLKKLESELKQLNKLSDEELIQRYSHASERTANDKINPTHQKGTVNLQSIFDLLPVSVWYKDTRNKFIRVNKAAADSCGLTVADIEGHYADEIFPFEAKKYHIDDLEVIESGKPKMRIIDSKTNQGITKWMRTDKLPWYSEQGKIIGVIALAWDITEHKKVEELYKTVISNAPISIFATDENGIFILNEGKALEKVGMEQGENIGVSAHSLFSNLKVIEHNGAIIEGKSVLNRISKGENISGLTEINGVIFDNQFAPIFDATNRIIGMVGVATDITEREKAENELILAKQRLQFLVSNSPTIIYSSKLSEDCEATYITKNVFQITGYQDNEFLSTPSLWKNCIHPEDLKKVQKNLSKVFKTGHLRQEYRFLHKDGIYRWIDDALKLVYDTNGNPLEIIGYRTDITESKLIFDALVKNEEELNEAQRLAKIGSWEWKYNSKKLKCSKEFYRIFDIDPRLVKKSYEEHLKILTIINKRRILKLMKGCIVSGEKKTIDFRIPSNKWLRARAECTYDEKGKIDGLLGTIQDITENVFEEEERRFHATIAKNLSEGISLIRQKDGIIVYTNQNFEEIFGYDQGELIGQHVSVLNAPSNVEVKKIAQNIIDSVKEHYKWKGEIHNIKKDGTLFYTEASVTQFEHPQFGKVLLAIQMKIDNRKQLEFKILKHQQELKYLSTQLLTIQENARRRIAIELHDEVGQSLTALKINLITVMKKIDSGEYLDIKERLSEMDVILEEIISQVHEISLDLRPAMLDVLGLLPTVKSYCNQFSKRTGINVSLNNDIKLNLNSEQEINLYRIIQEALTNVVKHAKAKNVIITVENKDGTFEMTFKDDGIGFNLNKNESDDRTMGIGHIGMRERITSLDGKFELDSRPGRGTIIKIKIPIK